MYEVQQHTQCTAPCISKWLHCISAKRPTWQLFLLQCWRLWLSRPYIVSAINSSRHTAMQTADALEQCWTYWTYRRPLVRDDTMYSQKQSESKQVRERKKDPTNTFPEAALNNSLNPIYQITLFNQYKSRCSYKKTQCAALCSLLLSDLLSPRPFTQPLSIASLYL